MCRFRDTMRKMWMRATAIASHGSGRTAVVFGAVLLIVIVSYNQRLALLLSSLLLLAYGSIVQEGWKTGQRFRTVLFVSAISIGGLGSTRAWNLFDDYERKRTLLLAVARDWKLNEEVLKFPKFSTSDANTLSRTFQFPKFYSVSLSPAMSSGLFDEDKADDSAMLRTIYAYSVSLTKLQERLDLSDQTHFVGIGRDSLKDWQTIRRGQELRMFKEVHMRLGRLLQQGGWLTRERFLVSLALDLDALRDRISQIDKILVCDDSNAPDAMRISGGDWQMMQECHAQFTAILAPGGYFEYENIFPEDEEVLTRWRAANDAVGRILRQMPVSADGYHALGRDAHLTIKQWQQAATDLLAIDKWLTKELDLLGEFPRED